MHFTNHAEPRPLYYPFNGTLAYLPLLHFQLGPRSFSLQSLLSWLVIAPTTYLFARDLGGSRLVAWATLWLVCLTPNILLQALSTNDEIVAATPLLVGLFFLHRWFYGRQHFDALLGVIGVSISAGTKLHVSFYWPVLLAVVAMIVINHRESAKELRNWMTVRGFAIAVTMILAVAVFAFSFVVYNYASAGRATAWEFNVQLLNTPFNWRAAFQNVVLYTAQVILTPIADLQIAINSTDRALHYEAFNKIVAPIFAWVNNGPEFTSVSYRFTGVNTPSAVAFNEHTLFIGFTWLIAAMAFVLVWRGTASRFLWGRFHLASLPVWAVTFAASTRYIEGFSVYLGYATIVAGPALVYAFLPIKPRRLDQLRWIVIFLVVATHCYFALSILLTSSPRNLIDVARAQSLPLSRGFQIDQSVLNEIARANNGIYSHTIAWGQPHWVLMAYNPKIRQFLASNPPQIPVPADEPSDPVSVALRFSRYVIMPRSGEPYLHVYTFPQLTAYGYTIPIRIPDKVEPGLTLIGNLLFALGPEWVFAAGNGVETRHPGNDKYLVLKYEEHTDFGHAPEPVIRLPPVVYGLGRRDDLSFRFELRIDGKLVGSTDWNPVPVAEFKAPGLKVRQRSTDRLGPQQHRRRHGLFRQCAVAEHQAAAFVGHKLTGIPR